MTQQEQQAVHAMIAIAIPVLLILAIAILYHVTAKKAHQQNLKDLDERYSMPKK